MDANRQGQVAVIFVNQRTGEDDEGYHAAAAEMERLAALQEGYCGVASVRAEDGKGITVSYWASESAAKAWRDHPEHSRIRERGRDRWYRSYSVQVSEITRSYDWSHE